MNGTQRAVVWIGLILIGLNLAMRWADVRSVIFGGSIAGTLLSSPSSKTVIPGSARLTNPSPQQTPAKAQPGTIVV